MNSNAEHEDDLVRLPLMVPRRLIGRLDREVRRLRGQQPYERPNRSQLVRHAIASFLNQIDADGPPARRRP